MGRTAGLEEGEGVQAEAHHRVGPRTAGEHVSNAAGDRWSVVGPFRSLVSGLLSGWFSWKMT